MAGHSHSANIARRKGYVDAKRAKIFSKVSRFILSAARQGGADPDMNLRLKYAIEAARAVNMPKDNIERVLKRAVGDKSGGGFEELVYEGYAPGGVALIITCLTDNRARTISDLKHIMDKRGGNIGAPGSVGYMFDKRSIFNVETPGLNEDQLTELALEVGADDVQPADGAATFVAGPTEFLAVKAALEKKGLKFISAEVGYMPQNTVAVGTKPAAAAVLALIEALEDNDDVQNVYANYDIAAELMPD
jgi:YebC/PmpR family DNA-binding regulatory protein